MLFLLIKRPDSDGYNHVRVMVVLLDELLGLLFAADILVLGLFFTLRLLGCGHVCILDLLDHVDSVTNFILHFSLFNFDLLVNILVF